MPSILFVCTANRFRSPLAAAFFQHELERTADAPRWKVNSAGTWADRGSPILPEIYFIARRYGLDLASHRSQPVTASLLASQDLILVMEAGQQEALQNEFPAAAERVHLLSSAAEGRRYNIPDAAHSLDAMYEIAATLHELIHKGFSNICSLAAQPRR